jgi:demethylmenaquinone methyltransferase/2-methoxy-6-polyprenyl-1,4-benzoquinol methylase
MLSWRKKYYDHFSKYYDRFVALHSSDAGGSLRAYLAGQTGALKDDRVLDICSGTGSLLLKLQEKTGTGGLVVGIDFSIGMLKAAREKIGASPTVCLVQADAGHLPFRNTTFDAVTCSHAFYELKGRSQDACLKEISRTLKPAKPFLLMEHEVPSRRFVRLLFYIRMFSMGSGRAFQILKHEKKLLLTYFRSAKKIRTPSGNSKIWICENRR